MDNGDLPGGLKGSDGESTGVTNTPRLGSIIRCSNEESVRIGVKVALELEAKGVEDCEGRRDPGSNAGA